MSKIVKIRVEQESPFRLKGVNERGQIAYVDGPAEIGGSDQAFRPMEMVLMALAGCTSMDVLSILRKQRQTVEYYAMDVEGVRADATPAVYTEISLFFRVRGAVDPRKLDEAIRLSAEKYCSVSAMLERGGVKIQWRGAVEA